MYRFSPIEVPGFLLVESRPRLTEVHKKRFLPGTTPTNQGTLNLYLAGSFLFEIPGAGFECTLSPGQTNLDIALSEFPEGLCTERALQERSWRMCLSPRDRTARWSRRIASIDPGGELGLSSGDVAIVLQGSVSGPSASWVLGDVVRDESIVTSGAGAKVAVARLL